MSQCVQVMGLNRAERTERVSVSYDEIQHRNIPIVFHVLYTSEANNIPNTTIYEALEDINLAFGAIDYPYLNDQSTDAKISFCLPLRDPDGNGTSGITRHDMSDNSEFAQFGVRTGGGAPAGLTFGEVVDVAEWDTQRYLNIYIVPEINNNGAGNGVQGFAALGYSSFTDGCVLLYNVVGEATAKLGSTDSKVLVHEIGHALNLYHTFQSSQGCDSESNCETQGDRVCDTPPIQGPYTCSGTTCGYVRSNYMDYFSNVCRESFTVGQVERMHQELLGPRANLGTGSLTPCDAQDAYDVAITDVQYAAEICGTAQDVTVYVGSIGENLPEGDVYVTLAGQGQLVSLSNAAPTAVVFEDVPTGTYGVNISNIQDMNASNDTETVSFSVDPESTTAFVQFEPSFWSNENDWSIVPADGSNATSNYYFEYPIDAPYEERTLCLQKGCYRFSMVDIAGDGFCSLDLDDDGVCDFGTGSFELSVQGETLISIGLDTLFSQYTATFCVEAEEYDPCLGDFNFDGTVSVADLVGLLAHIGTTNATYDVDGSGLVTVQDYLTFLGYWGEDCGEGFDLQLAEKLLEEALDTRGGTTYDLSGRAVKVPTTTGIYIVVDELGNATKKYIQCEF